MPKLKLSFIGALNYSNLPLDGETAKNQIFLSFLKSKFSDLKFIDTYKWNKSLKTFIRLFNEILLIRDRILIISICPDSANILSKILFFSRRKERMYYFVIGGNFADRIVTKIYNAKYYSQYTKIFVEGRSMVEKLLEFGLNNVEYLPNFKKFNNNLVIDNSPKNIPNSIFHFVFLSRITEQKGVTLILEAIKKLNTENLADKYDVTFYGQIDEEYNNFFNNEISKYVNVIYNGFLNMQIQSSYHILSKYDLMLFPTYWQGEGFPGVILDAFIAGLPIIASDWNLNAEIIENDITGYIISPRNSEELYSKMKYVLLNKNDIFRMKINCSKKAIDFQANNVLDKINI